MKFCVGLKMGRIGFILELIQVSSQIWIPLSTDECCLCVPSFLWQYVSDSHFWVMIRVIQFSNQLSLLQESVIVLNFYHT